MGLGQGGLSRWVVEGYLKGGLRLIGDRAFV